ncbi:MAG: hypothetical protein J1E61_04640 [Lachnospiraceae bacterium]|nr:hypothetical protein [Lachnospiraceae bacterium]
MVEKVYHTMTKSGALNITLGILTITAGIAAGVLLIISGAKLLSRKSGLMF